MSLSARTPAAADTAGFVPEIWSQLIIDAAQKELVALDATDHTWQVGKKQGDTVNIGITNHVTATEVVVGTEGTNLDIATGTKKQLVMDQWYEAVIPVDSMTMEQSQIDWAAQCRKEAEYAIRVVIDTSVCTLFSTLNSDTVKGTDGSAITDDLLIEVKELLDEADVPDDDRFLIVDPSVIADMMVYDKFVSSLYVPGQPVVNGTIAKNHPIYGCSVRKTNNLVAVSGGTGAYAVMMHSKAIASALQINKPYIDSYQPRKHQTFFCHEALWGVLEVRDTYGIPFYTRKS